MNRTILIIVVVTPISFVAGESVCVEVGEEDFKDMLGQMESYMMGRWEEAPFRALCAEGFRGRQHLPVAAEIQKKIPTETHRRTPSSIKTGSITKRRV